MKNTRESIDGQTLEEDEGQLARLSHERVNELRSIDPHELAEKVKRRVIGQDASVDWLAQCVCMMLDRNLAIVHDEIDDKDLPRLGSLWILAPTASGKTHMIRTLMDELDVKLRVIDCTSLTGSGWRGNGTDSEMEAVAHDLEDDPSGMVAILFDEADKLALDFSDDCIRSFNAQPSLLKLLDAGIYSGRGESKDGRFSLDTSRCIFIFAGAFTGIERIVKKRLESENPFYGFVRNDTSSSISSLSEAELRRLVEPKDLVDWGLHVEFLGRITSVRSMDALCEEAMGLIVKGSEHSLEKRFSLLFPNEVRFEIEDRAVANVVRRALDTGLGARQLESLIAPLAAEARAAYLHGSHFSKAVIVVENDALALSYE